MKIETTPDAVVAAPPAGVGVGTSYIDPEGDLIMTYVPPVTSMYIDGDGNLSLEY